MNQKRYLVVANRFGKLSVMVNEDLTLSPGDAILYRAHTIDEAFDWKDSMDASVSAIAHCVTCEN